MNRRRAKGRDIDGILLLDKPVGITSNAALQEVKRIFFARKAGHTGSLDPIATGLLPICFGEATKFSQFLLDADKSYRVTCKLGIKTTTGDIEGEIVEQKPLGNICAEMVETVLAKFCGEIEQIPPMYSAIKHNGEPLYKLARRGETIERKARTVFIYKIDLLDFTDELLELEIKCSKGTYIRTLVENIGEELKCGAHVAALRRLTHGSYSEDQMVSLQKIKQIAEESREKLDDFLLPLESAVSRWSEVLLSEAAAYYLLQGQSVIVPYAPKEGCVQLKMKDGRFLGVGEILPDGKLAPRRLLANKL